MEAATQHAAGVASEGSIAECEIAERERGGAGPLARGRPSHGSKIEDMADRRGGGLAISTDRGLGGTVPVPARPE